MGYQNVCGLVSLFLGARSHCRNNESGRIAVSHIILKNDYRACTALF